MVFVLKLKDGREYSVDASLISFEGNDFLGYLEKGKNENFSLGFSNEDVNFNDVKSIEILIHEHLENELVKRS